VSEPVEPTLVPPELELGDEDVIAEVTELEQPAALDRSSGFDGVGTRREARERALSLLYEAEQKELAPAELLATLPVPPEAFTVALVVGVSEHLEELDRAIGSRAIGWKVERMPALDRAVLRMGTYELAHSDVPVGVCISEAVELAKRYSTDDSPTFVNGLLSRLADDLRPAG
jgi:N utilization substance protein B